MVLCSLEFQKEKFGPLLRQPLPLSLVDSSHNGTPELAHELMPYAGDGKETFHDLISESGVSRNQLQNVVVVTPLAAASHG